MIIIIIKIDPHHANILSAVETLIGRVPVFYEIDIGFRMNYYY
jgi:hypothetical protein